VQKQFIKNDMKIRPSIQYWNALDSSIQQKLIARFDKIFFCFGLFLILVFITEISILLLDKAL
jgi:hypothetical protein